MKALLLSLFALALAAAPLRAEEIPPEGSLADYQSLLENSPFLSLAFKERLAKAGAAGADRIRFTGYAFVEGEWIVCLEPEAGKPHKWLKVGESIRGHEIESFDEKAQSLTLKKGSIRSTVALKKP